MGDGDTVDFGDMSVKWDMGENHAVCLVTGVAGFVGSHLAERLLTLGHAVVGVDNFASGYLANMDGFRDHPGFAFHERSISEPGLMEELVERHPGLGCVFHLAAIVSVPYSVSHPEATMAENFEATRSLLAAAERHRFHAFVFAGSAAEYGDDPRLPLREAYATEATQHLSPYGRAKFLASTCIAQSPIGVALRFFNIYGPRQDPRSPYSGVISRFADAARLGEALTIFGDGEQTRDFIYVADVVEAYLRAAGLTGPAVPPGIYNVGTGQATSIRRLAETVCKLTGNSTPIRHLPDRPGDIRHSVADVSAFQTATGWDARTRLYKGLEETLKR